MDAKIATALVSVPVEANSILYSVIHELNVAKEKRVIKREPNAPTLEELVSFVVNEEKPPRTRRWAVVVLLRFAQEWSTVRKQLASLKLLRDSIGNIILREDEELRVLYGAVVAFLYKSGELDTIWPIEKHPKIEPSEFPTALESQSWLDDLSRFLRSSNPAHGALQGKTKSFVVKMLEADNNHAASQNGLLCIVGPHRFTIMFVYPFGEDRPFFLEISYGMIERLEASQVTLYDEESGSQETLPIIRMHLVDEVTDNCTCNAHRQKLQLVNLFFHGDEICHEAMRMLKEAKQTCPAVFSQISETAFALERHLSSEPGYENELEQEEEEEPYGAAIHICEDPDTDEETMRDWTDGQEATDATARQTQSHEDHSKGGHVAGANHEEETIPDSFGGNITHIQANASARLVDPSIVTNEEYNASTAARLQPPPPKPRSRPQKRKAKDLKPVCVRRSQRLRAGGEANEVFKQLTFKKLPVSKSAKTQKQSSRTTTAQVEKNDDIDIYNVPSDPEEEPPKKKCKYASKAKAQARSKPQRNRQVKTKPSASNEAQPEYEHRPIIMSNDGSDRGKKIDTISKIVSESPVNQRHQPELRARNPATKRPGHQVEITEAAQADLMDFETAPTEHDVTPDTPAHTRDLKAFRSDKADATPARKPQVIKRKLGCDEPKPPSTKGSAVLFPSSSTEFEDQKRTILVDESEIKRVPMVSFAKTGPRNQGRRQAQPATIRGIIEDDVRSEADENACVIGASSRVKPRPASSKTTYDTSLTVGKKPQVDDGSLMDSENFEPRSQTKSCIMPIAERKTPRRRALKRITEEGSPIHNAHNDFMNLVPSTPEQRAPRSLRQISKGRSVWENLIDPLSDNAPPFAEELTLRASGLESGLLSTEGRPYGMACNLSGWKGVDLNNGRLIHGDDGDDPFRESRDETADVPNFVERLRSVSTRQEQRAPQPPETIDLTKDDDLDLDTDLSSDVDMDEIEAMDKAAEEEWEAALQPRHRTLLASLNRITRQFLGHVMNSEEALFGEVDDYFRKGNEILQAMDDKYAEEVRKLGGRSAGALKLEVMSDLRVEHDRVLKQVRKEFTRWHEVDARRLKQLERKKGLA